jgi:hypothetical protein
MSAEPETWLENIEKAVADMVNHPPHYTSHPSGIECIQVTEHMGFCVGNAIKYLWRADEKGTAIQDLEKAKWYIDREIYRRVRAEIAYCNRCGIPHAAGECKRGER